MHHKLLLALAAFFLTTVAASAATPVGKGAVVSLSVLPEKVALTSADHIQQLVVTAHHANGGLSDVSGLAMYRPGNAKLVQVDAAGMMTPLGNGTTEVVAEYQGKTVRVSVAVSGTERERPIDFVNEVIPILTKFGCNTGACHGKAEGQNGFKLSLLGFDTEADYAALALEGRGRRTTATAPERSLLLLKATGSLGHGGGKLIPTASPEYQLLKRWIAGGLPQGSAKDPKIERISVAPAQRTLALKAPQQLAVTAHYSNGSSKDVTSWAEFRSNDDDLALVGKTGRVDTRDRTGAAAVMIRYLGHVAVFRADIPQDAPTSAFPKHAESNFIDRHVFAKLHELGIPPAELCSDGDFLRRVSIDITGTLPTAAEAEKFLADKDPQKRAKLVDNLLERPAYATYFTLKWGDVLRLRGGGRTIRKEGDKPQVVDTPAQRADAFHAWIKDSIRTNKPYDQFVREIVTAQGVTSGPEAAPPIVWYVELKTPEGLVDDTAQAFLGTRIQCARCHHHPFEKWSEDDYWGLAMFFGRLQWHSRGRDANSTGPFQPVRLVEGGKLGQKVAFDPKITLTSSRGKVYAQPKPLDGAPMTIAADDDPRHRLVDWMARPDNPFFARTLTNRYWGHFFGRGIVDPLDDLRVTNPPSNPELLDALAKDFIAHKFDLKHLIRVICNSTTYQLSSRASEFNKNDKQNFARYNLRRLPAEVLSDAIDQVANSPTEFTAAGGLKYPLGTRAIELPDIFTGSYFLEVFGKSKRTTACECERESNVTLAQRAHLLNSAGLRQKLAARAGHFAADKRGQADKIREIYLTFYCRVPTPEELETVKKYLTAKGNNTQAYHDVLWALLNTKEFVFSR